MIIGFVFLAIGLGKLCFSWEPTTRLEALFPGCVRGMAVALAIIFFVIAVVQIRRDQRVEEAEKGH